MHRHRFVMMILNHRRYFRSPMVSRFLGGVLITLAVTGTQAIFGSLVASSIVGSASPVNALPKYRPAASRSSDGIGSWPSRERSVCTWTSIAATLERSITRLFE